MTKSPQRFNPDILIDCLVSTFGSGGIHQFRQFLARHPFVTKWIVVSDFVINEAHATSDAYAYTFFPYDADLLVLKARLSELFPKDFKKTRNVPTKLHEFFQSGETFTICLLTPKKYNAAGDIGTIRASLDATIVTMRNWRNVDSQQAVIKAFERLRERANSNSFNKHLMSSMMIATVLAAFCAIILAQERKIEVVGWFPDRDSITIAYERIADQLFSVDFSAFCQRYKIEQGATKTVIGYPEPDPANPKHGWYDELVRVPDFLAGPLAGWNYKENLVTGRQKYVDILLGAVADNPYLITLLLNDTEKGIGVSRLLCSKRPMIIQTGQTDQPPV